MCDTCSDFIHLLVNYESKIYRDSNEQQPALSDQDVDVINTYLQSWSSRQCMCCYRDVKNLERFCLITQGLIYLGVCQCKALAEEGAETTQVKISEESVKNVENKEDAQIQDRDKLLNLIAKIFLLNFPLYVAYKHTPQTKVDELTQQEIQNLSLFCDLHDSEIPIYLLKNVSWFCKIGGLLAMTTCFTMLTPDLLPVSTAHAMISIVCNLKLWMNYKSMITMLVPLRSCVLRYMCKLSDQDLRTPTIKSMADFMWNAIKDPLDAPVAFDIDGLDLAFKYFTSSTLTMRLAGITQINSQIGVLAELCVGEALPEAEAAPHHMADWLISNNIISHIFGPNLHVEVIKQSHIILNFLAMEGRITCDHMDVIWAAAQLKHCAKPIYDLLPGLVKHLAVPPTLHLYNLLTKLEPKEHTEQTLFLASALTKSVWSRSGAVPDVGVISLAASNAGITLHKCPTSSENSVSLDPSNSEEEHGESTGQSDSEDLEGVEIQEASFIVDNSGPPPCKLPRRQALNKRYCEGSSTDPELDGITIVPSLIDKKKIIGKIKPAKKHFSSARKKMLAALNILHDGVEPGGTSSSQDEIDHEDENVKYKKRRKMLRKTRVKRQKSKQGFTVCHKRVPTSIGDIHAFSDQESDHEVKQTLKAGLTAIILPTRHLVDSNLKQVTYVEDSSSCSELGKDSLPLEEHGPSCAGFMTIRRRNSHMLELLSGEEAEGDGEGSYSSRMSTKSEKNMADFEGEDSGCEEELAQLAENAQLNIHSLANQSSPEKSPIRVDPKLSANFKAENVCKPGNTLLWDLLQDNKICQLSEGLALEAEKTLCNLICYTQDKDIRMKFIEGCLKNLENHTSVVVSLKLLPKLLTSFRTIDMHQVTNWAEKQHHMMTHFFNNLKYYTSDPTKSLPLYTHQMQVQVRLHFLSAVFSPVVSPTTFKLTLEQVDTLWDCLAKDSECSDELFSWLLSQTKTSEFHALKMDALRRLYSHHLPKLPPEKFSMICLGLFQQLCSLNHLLMINMDGDMHRVNLSVGMDHMWNIALRANNTDVSLAAIQYINIHYMGQNLQNESQFVWQCMTHLKAAAHDLTTSKQTSTEEASLLCIQRGLLLMKSHIETFRRRYAYHLRKWAIEGKGVGSHSATVLHDRSCTPVKITVQATNISDRLSLELSSLDFVADLRAEIVKWYESQVKNIDQTKPLELCLRIVSQGQELSFDCDEKTLGEIGFKETQIVFVTVNIPRSTKKRDYIDSPSMHPSPPRDSIPTLLLLRANFLEQLFSLMHTLSSMKIQIKGGRQIPHTKAQVLSRRVWDILSLLPTSPRLLQGFKQLDMPLSELLDPSSAQKLMYSLYIVESLSCKSFRLKNSDYSEKWVKMFIQHGGLRHLFDIFMSGVLQADGGDGSEWQLDCLASLLKIICQLGVEPLNTDIRISRTDKVLIPSLNEDMLAMMDIKTTMPQLTGILEEASLPKDTNHYRTGFWGRPQVIHYTMGLLVSWLHSCPEARESLFQSKGFSVWLKRLVLEDPDPAVRREVCSGIYRLCLGISASGATKETGLVPPILAQLLNYLENAESMRPQKIDMQVSEEGKEPYGPACRDYFWLVCRLVDSLSDDFIKESIEDPQNCVIDINSLTDKVAKSILTRDFLESRHQTVDDDGLIGLINLLTNLVKHKLPFQSSKAGEEVMSEVFDFLFALPNPKLRYVPKCKSARSRTASFDLIVELVKTNPHNYDILHEKLLKQHLPGPNSPYPWDYWPHEDGRSECGYVGLTNLGATCYMASCMQHLYMMPQTRASILAANTKNSKHEPALKELQRMFAYLLESERKAYNPRSFCKVYTMDHQPLNTAEQKDMAEFFIDLVSKLEEMTPELKAVIKNLFCGVISNNVVSLDCGHVSCTLEEFYTVRCQVADMRNLYESLDEVTVKDTLEGDNMYTCSQCGKKVRAEKRACFKTLPHILCFNTMRYTFNMLTMLKEKVNTHFSFPMRLNMAGYNEKRLMPKQYQDESSNSETEQEQYEYDLIGVTVHTGTADGGHYYSFIKDRTSGSRDKWFLFNDAEVKPFDPNQIAAECFGGEMTSKTYDSVNDKFMDFSFEKTNSAYMLFYERCSLVNCESSDSTSAAANSVETLNNNSQSSIATPNIELSKELEDWIWEDNMKFIQDKNIFEHTYFNFMWQICGYIPQTILPIRPNITQKATQLSVTFFIETFIHAKEKPTMVQWVELVTKQFNACEEACVWFLEHMCEDTWWLVQVLLKCPNQMVRQMFQRLCIHVIQRLRGFQPNTYLQITGRANNSSEKTSDDLSKNNRGCSVIRFLNTLFSLLVKIAHKSQAPNEGKQVKTSLSFADGDLLDVELASKAQLKYLPEYFGFLYDFSKMGEDEAKYLLSVNAISTMISFYLGQKSNHVVEVSEGEDDEEIITVPTEKCKPGSLERMITLISYLVEKSRDNNMKLQLSEKDYTAVAGGKGLPFLYQQIKDNIILSQTRNLINSLCKGNIQMAHTIIGMILQAIAKHSEASAEFDKKIVMGEVHNTCFMEDQPFFKMLTLLTEVGGHSSASYPCLSQMVLQKLWEAAENCPYIALDWLAVQVSRNRLIQQFVISTMDTWVEPFLIAHNNQRVRNTAGYLLVSAVPSPAFRQGFRATHRLQKDMQLTGEAQVILHQIYTGLLRLMGPAKHYTDVQPHGTTKLTTYFALLMYCCLTQTEKLMFGPYFLQLWQLFHPKLSEPSIPAHHNKQALLAFWNHVCTDCPENVQLMLQNAHVTKNIAFNYILADHDDQEIILFNRAMLPSYYGILRMMCQRSRVFTRHLAQHQNLQWAFKNITPNPTHYSQAVEELFKLMQLMSIKHPDTSESEQREICSFKRNTLTTYLQCLDGRTSWTTLISVFRILLDTNDDKMYVIYNRGLLLVFESFQHLHTLLHEATACHIAGDLIEILSIMQDLLRCLKTYIKEARGILLGTKDWIEVLSKLATLLNTYNSPEIRGIAIEILKEFVLIITPDAMQVLVPLLSHCHSAFQDSQDAVPLGPYFPRRGGTLPVLTKVAVRPLRPMVQMTVPHNQLESTRGVDPVYDLALDKFYTPYHEFIDVLIRLAINNETVPEMLVNLSAVIGFEAVPLHSTYFPKLWLDILRTTHIDQKYVTMLTTSNYFVDYVDAILLDERLALTIDVIYDFLVEFFPKVASHVLSEQTLTMIYNTVVSLNDQVSTIDVKKTAKRLAGDLRALILVYKSPNVEPPSILSSTLKQLQSKAEIELRKLDTKEEASTENCGSPRRKAQLKTEPRPSTSKKDESEIIHVKVKSSILKSDSDSESSSSSEESLDNHKLLSNKTVIENVKLLDSVIKELLSTVDKKA